MKDELMNSSSIVVAHYSGLSVLETDELRKEMRNNGAKFRVTKNRLTKLALAETQFKDIAYLFTGPTAIAYSSDPVAPAKVAVNFEKKSKNFKISIHIPLYEDPKKKQQLKNFRKVCKSFLTISAIAFLSASETAGRPASIRCIPASASASAILNLSSKL